MPATDPQHERGGGDHDQPYTFGHPPTWTSPTPFTPGQLSWLIFHRNRRQDGKFDDDMHPEGSAFHATDD
jgi:hypothetical protein